MGCFGRCICTLPHGRMSLYVLSLGFVTWVCAGFVAYGCRFIQADIPTSLLYNDIHQNGTSTSTDGINYIGFNPDVNFDNNQTTATATASPIGEDDEEPILVTMDLGVFHYPSPNTDEWACLHYDEGSQSGILFDASFATTRAAAHLSACLLGVCCLVLLAMSCLSVSPAAIKLLAILCLTAGGLELFTYMIFATTLCNEYRCHFASGCFMPTVVFVLAAIDAFFIYNLPRNAAAASDEQDGVVSTLLVPGTTDVSEMVFADGSKKVIKTTVNMDGSQTVEETTILVEQPNPTMTQDSVTPPMPPTIPMETGQQH